MSDSIFSKLSAVNVNEFKEKKGKFDYLSWTDAWAELMKHYPTATHEMLEDIHYPDGSMEVRSSVTIDGHTLKMFLPVIDHRNNAIAHPNAFDVNKNRMRCLVKNIAMHGLGLYIFQGEDFPEEPQVTFTQEQRDNLIDLMSKSDGWGLKKLSSDFGGDVMTELFNSFKKGEVSKNKDMARSLIAAANKELRESMAFIENTLNDPDIDSKGAIDEHLSEMNKIQLAFTKAGLNEVQLRQLEAEGIQI